MNKVSYINETKGKIEELAIIKKVIQYALKQESVTNAEFTIIFVDNHRIQEINREYRGFDQTTDVISFAFEDFKDIEYNNYRLLGEIYLSLDKAKEQSVEYGHSLLRELCFLSVHGLLHLLGYDHMNEEDEKKMFKKQEGILNEFGIKRE